MAGNIKGITIEFDGNTTKLSKALTDIKEKSKAVNSALKDVNKVLKFNPGNTELLAQKQTLLKEKIQATKDKLETFKQAQQTLDAQGVDKTSKEYMEVRRNIIECESKLKNFNNELKKTDAAASHVGQLGKKFQDTGEKISGAGRAFAPVSKVAGVVSGALGATAYKAARAADDINTLSKVSGIGTKELQIYAASADLVDVSVEDMAKAQTKLKKNMFNAAKGTGDAAIAFEKLGVKVVGNDGHLRNQNDVFQETIKKLGSMKNETERDALAMQIFGKSATQLNPMIEDMGKTYQLVTETMKKNKIKFVDQETLDQANAFNDQVDTMKFIAITAFQQIGSKIAAALLPAITKIQEGFSKLMGYISNMDGRVLAVITGIAGAIAAVAPVLLIVGGLMSKFGKALSSLAQIAPGFSGALGKAFGFLKANPIILVVAALAALALMIGKTGMSAEQVSDKIASFVNSAVNMINGIVAKMPEIINSLINGLITMLPALVQGAVTLYMGLVQALPKILPALIQGLIQLITMGIQTLPAMMPIVINTAILLFMEIVKAIPAIAVALFQAMPQVLNAVLVGLQPVIGIVGNIFENVKNTISDIWNSIKAWITTTVNNIGTNIATGFNSVKTTVTNIWNAIKSAITNPINAAYNAVSNIIQRIRSLFNFTWKLPHLKLPHVSISGGFSLKPLKVPHFDLKWYKEGGIFDKPTIAGIGEAGSEAVLPTHKLDRFLEEAVLRTKGSERTDELLETMIMLMQSMMRDMPRKMVEEMAGTLKLDWNDRELGRMVKNYAR